MPQIQIYIDNENFVRFINLPSSERERIRKMANKTIKDGIDLKPKVEG